jgi:hypothetical protein
VASDSIDDQRRIGIVHPEFPKHGRAINNVGQECLWLPILRLLHHGGLYKVSVHEVDGRVRIGHVVNEHLLRYTNYSKAGYSTLTRLVEVLRQLAEQLREFEEINKEKSAGCALANATVRVPICVDYSFILLRRLCDQIVIGLAPRLYEAPRSAPRELKKLVNVYPQDAKPKFDISIYESLQRVASNLLTFRPPVGRMLRRSTMVRCEGPVSTHCGPTRIVYKRRKRII